MVLALVLSALVAAGSPASSGGAARPACFQDARDLEKHRQAWGKLGGAAEKQEPRLLVRALPALREFLALSAFRTRTGEPVVAPAATGRAAVDWWDRGGGDWIASVLANYEEPAATRKVAIAPTMRSVVDPKRVPGELICSKGPCDREAEYLVKVRARTMLLLEAYSAGRAHGAYTEHPGTIFRGPHVSFTPLPYQCPEDSHERWEACVLARRSIRPEFPIGDYRLPRSGWLFIEPSGQLRQECPDLTAVDLATGAAIWTRKCTVLWGHGDRQRAREFALVAALASSVEEVVDFQEIEVPEHLADEARCSLSSAVMPYRGSSHSSLNVWWWNEGRIVLDTSMSHGPDKPGAGLARGMFAKLRHTLRVGGEAPSVPDVASVADNYLKPLLRAIDPGLGAVRAD